ncbi:MAG: hydroxymethylpyrimidine/phosphomethylpyrimidine kinase [Acidimicrobiales bacterium]|nr:hydroxymethylpyrimidine/phosphomethylpyrimidine kinase [Acidimicrobiales bacterium]MDG2218866.1 hydroxymethylpyrimidine/phosphomethylpyrimidine kinase [Acidimicrobiales bacterium]
MALSVPTVVLALAAHDPLGGAGLAADLTTFAALNVHGTVAVTAVTAQTLTTMSRALPMETAFVAAQIAAVASEFTIAGAKTGMVLEAESVALIAELIDDGQLPAPVVDPVLVDGRGVQFAQPEVEAAYRSLLIPRARVLTPNIAEASVLTGRSLDSVRAVEAAATDLASLGAEWVVVTAGSLTGDATDIAIDRFGAVHRLVGDHLDTPHVRGSGCTFAAATTALLARGVEPLDAFVRAKAFVHAQLVRGQGWALADGVAGPVAHWQPAAE